MSPMRSTYLKKLIEIGIISDIKSVPRGFQKISREAFVRLIENLWLIYMGECQKSFSTRILREKLKAML